MLHVLARAGFKVRWRDNQSGCKGVCDGLPVDQLDHANVPALCAEGQCLDEILVHGMDGVARDNQGNLFVVMHQLGSHGPAYYKRYPAVFKRFTPACESEDLHSCSQSDIVNAYDNSLLYTDFVLGRVIDFLDRAQATHDTAMLYVSDHGESLGEGGLYLHGMPYAIAPDVQTRVPFVMWLSPAFRRSFGINQECLRGRADRAGVARQSVPFAAGRAGRRNRGVRQRPGSVRALSRRASGRGNKTLTSRPPPGASSSTTVAPCRCATARTIARPRPLPLEAVDAGRSVKAVEYTLALGGRDAGTAVRHAEAGLSAHPGGSHVDLSAGRGVTQRVVDQIVEQDRELLGVAWR